MSPLKGEPGERLDPRAKTLWRITGAMGAVPLLAVGGSATWGMIRGAGLPIYVGGLPVFGTVLLAVLMVAVMPGLRWRRWRYEIRSEEVDLQRGILWTVRTLVPLSRIQHVDTRSGPLERRFGLATVIFYTAAGPNEVPELALPVAGEVRDRISELTREQDEL